MSTPKKKNDLYDIASAVPCKSNLLHLEMCRRVSANVSDKISQPHGKTYLSLVETTTDDGIREQLVELDYPITPDYVKSFEASANYKNDPVGAIAQSVPRHNLGDLTEVQRVENIDTAELTAMRARLDELSKKVQSAQPAQPAQSVQPVQSEV